ncbi:MAG: hypothetical protein A2857_05905 [Candidatus Levybacteria bacterium RIFCSPHIGHO2_01_FULL_36_15]|nr:MAG: hypothetical protein A2857_05905 [Candidatus Levybacteria bacterium RIFCSPHIGHO2_01_FULL_36_15]
MLYFSELDKIKIYSNNGKFIGILDDLIFSVINTPYITKLVVVSSTSSIFPESLNIFQKKEKLIIPIQNLQKINHVKMIIDERFSQSEIAENELFVKRNLLDTQVIDIEENDIVRVNDVLIHNVGVQGLAIYGVDMGFSGILRWLKLEKKINKLLRVFGLSITQSILAWSDIQPLELTRGRVVVKTTFDKLKGLHPADVADYLETQNFKNALALIQGIDKGYLAEVVSELNPNFQSRLLKRLGVDKIVYILSMMETDDAVDVLTQFSQKRRDAIMEKLPPKESAEIKRLLKFSETPLGEFLTIDFLTVYSEDTCLDVIKKIKNSTVDFSTLEYVYIVNKENQLIGVTDLHELILQNSDNHMFRFMVSKVVSATLSTPVEVAFRRMSKYKISSLPVIDQNKQILGIVQIEDLSREIIQRIE